MFTIEYENLNITWGGDRIATATIHETSHAWNKGAEI